MRKCAIIVLLVLLLFINPISAQEICGRPILWFNHEYSPDIEGYEELQVFPSGNTEIDENVTVINTGGPVLIDSYILPADTIEVHSKLYAGLRKFTTWHYVSSAVGTTQINFTAFQRHTDGSESIFYSQLSDDIDALTVTDYTTYRISTEDLDLMPGDRLGIKVYAQTTHSSPITVHFVYQGTTHASHFESGYFDCTPIVTPTIPNFPAPPLITNIIPWYWWALALVVVVILARLFI